MGSPPSLGPALTCTPGQQPMLKNLSAEARSPSCSHEERGAEEGPFPWEAAILQLARSPHGSAVGECGSPLPLGQGGY